MAIKGPGINRPSPGIHNRAPARARVVQPRRPTGPPSTKKPEALLKICMEELAGKPCSEPYQEYLLTGNHINIGRADDNDICLTSDPEASRKHCTISDCSVRDNGSFNGTFLNGTKLGKERVLLKPRDQLRVGLTVFTVKTGDVNKDELSKTKLFPGMSTLEFKEKLEEDERIAKMTVEELMDEEFRKIIGHDNIKQQLRRFYKKIQLDEIREKNGRLKNRSGAYHMIFQGPPGTGKTSMANLVSKVLVKMKLVKTNKVVFVNNALDLLAGFAGQTPGKVDAKVKEAEGGVLFIDEAYSIVQQGSGSSGGSEGFGKEAIDTIMKHLDPPSCVFIFAGYAEPMNDFLRVNEGLGRRVPFRYEFLPYTVEQLIKILQVMCEAKGEKLAPDVMLPQNFPELLESIDPSARETHNAGLISNFVAFAQIERDCRIDIFEAERNPSITCTLTWQDFVNAYPKLERMLEKNPEVGKYNDNAPPDEPQYQYQEM